MVETEHRSELCLLQEAAVEAYGRVRVLVFDRLDPGASPDLADLSVEARHALLDLQIAEEQLREYRRQRYSSSPPHAACWDD